MIPARIVILGGGTAGWMTACLMAHRWHARGTSISVVESPDIGIVGVGEGSTPQLRKLFDTLGIDEADWMPRCNATYKVGIGFRDWSARAGHTSYFHPFASALDGFTQPGFFANAQARRMGLDVEARPDRFYLGALLAAAGKAPIAPRNFPFDVGYGYHFDAHLIGAFLRDHATATLGVRHLARKIVEVVRDAAGNVAALRDDGGELIAGDIFVDCSGFRSVIVQQALGVPFQDFGHNLFNDSAVVIPTPADPERTNAHTIATALTSGWAWDIPLINRTGNGYVYSSHYIDADSAETELRAHLGLLDSGTPAQHLTMKVGRVRDSWSRNCLAVGLAQGFIEPLEATALHIVQATVEGFIEAFEQGDSGPAHRDEFNARIAARYEGIRDYIVLHYRVNQRADTSYWRDNAANQHLSDSLKAILTSWFTGQDLEAEIARQGIAKYYAPLSWHALLAGYGVFPGDSRLRPPDASDRTHDVAPVDDFLARCAMNFPDHKQFLEVRAE